MILAAQHIRYKCSPEHRAYYAKRAPLITPFYERTVAYGMTFGLSAAGYDVRIAETLYLAPGEFKRASTVERFNMPDDLLARVHDKSTWARCGLSVFNTVIEPGWRGYLTVELHNCQTDMHDGIYIAAGAPIAQIVFEQLLAPTQQPYKGKYQDQPAGPQAPIMEKADGSKEEG